MTTKQRYGAKNIGVLGSIAEIKAA